MDPSAVSLEKGAATYAHAILKTDMVHVPETTAISDMYVTNVAGPTQDVTALPHSGNGQGLAIATMEAQSPAPLIESKNTFPRFRPLLMYKDWRTHKLITPIRHLSPAYVIILGMGQTWVLLGGVSLDFSRICLLRLPSLILLPKKPFQGGDLGASCRPFSQTPTS